MITLPLVVLFKQAVLRLASARAGAVRLDGDGASRLLTGPLTREFSLCKTSYIVAVDRGQHTTPTQFA